MPQRVSLVCDDHLVDQVDELAREFDLPRQEVLRQLILTGLEELNR